MGMRIQCSQCHNHPFDRWTMDDYYGFAAFFSQIGRKGSEDPRELIVFNSGGGEVSHPVGGQRDEAQVFGRGDVPTSPARTAAKFSPSGSRRPRTPISPRIWRTSCGLTFSDGASSTKWTTSASAIRPSTRIYSTRWARNSPSTITTSSGWSRTSARSRTYQLSTEVNPTNIDDHRNFAHAELRRMRAEVMLDCISQATDTKNKFPGLPVGARAVQVADGNTSTYFLTTFGRATRGTACSCEVRVEPNLSQALHLLNGDSSNSKIHEGKLVRRRLDEKKPPADNSRRVVHSLPVPTSDSQGEVGTGGGPGRKLQQASGLGRHVLGSVEFARVFVQPLNGSA